jgi:inorganic pyrophosphatase
MLDHGEADDKIVGVLENDPFWSQVEDLPHLPGALVQRLRHYFLTYKLVPGEPSDISIGDAYGRPHAQAVIQAAMDDYQQEYGGEEAAAE